MTQVSGRRRASSTERANPQCRLTLPSKGRPQASFACLRPPLMSNVRPPNQSNAMRAPFTAEAHRTVAAVTSSSGRSVEHNARNRRGGPSVRKAAASERPHTFEAILGQVGSGSPSLVQPGREDVGNIASSFRQSVNTKLEQSRAVQAQSRKHQSPAMRVGVAREHEGTARVRSSAFARLATKVKCSWRFSQGQCLQRGGLTLPSNGHTTAGHNVSLRQERCRRCVPLMSHVRALSADPHAPSRSSRAARAVLGEPLVVRRRRFIVAFSRLCAYPPKIPPTVVQASSKCRVRAACASFVSSLSRVAKSFRARTEVQLNASALSCAFHCSKR